MNLLNLSVRHVGNRFNTDANTVTLDAYTVADAYVFVDIPKQIFGSVDQTRLTFRVRNLTDKRYAVWGDPFYPDQILLGTPRSVRCVQVVKSASMLRAIILLHRWLGVSFCLLFAMWFSTGMVMHFVPFPALTEAERIGGLTPIDPSRPLRRPTAAVDASGIKDARRVRLLQRSDGPVYVVTGASGVRAVHADDRTSAAVKSGTLALSMAEAAAHRRGLNASQAAVVAVADYDQWTVPNGFHRHRPLYRIALNDIESTEFYVSSVTGEVVLDTTSHERAWNYLGSVTHWIYPTILRSQWAVWDKTVWTLSLVALIAAISGSVLGILRMNFADLRIVSPYAGWHGWHHLLGLVCMTFVLTWILSGWLSMDHGRLFSRGQLTEAEATTVAVAPAWEAGGLPGTRRRMVCLRSEVLQA